MTEMDREINNIIMQEIGLEVGENNKIYDQDTGDAIKINGLNVVAPGCYTGRQSIEFDPYNNRKMMTQMFGYFLDKNSEETGIDAISYYNIEESGKAGKVECKMSDNTVITSKEYLRDSLKYTDIIAQLNGGELDLSKFDVPQSNDIVKRIRK